MSHHENGNWMNADQREAMRDRAVDTVSKQIIELLKQLPTNRDRDDVIEGVQNHFGRTCQS